MTRHLCRMLLSLGLALGFFVGTAQAYYGPQLGRFMQRDPIEYRGGTNLYGYVGGMPTRYVDPFGRVLTIPTGHTNIGIWGNWFGQGNLSISPGSGNGNVILTFADPDAALAHAADFFQSNGWMSESELSFLNLLYQMTSSDSSYTYEELLNRRGCSCKPKPNVYKVSEHRHPMLGWQECFYVNGRYECYPKHANYAGGPQQIVYRPLTNSAVGLNLSGVAGFVGSALVGGQGSGGGQILVHVDSGDIAVYPYVGAGPSVGTPGPVANVNAGGVLVHDIHNLDEYSGPFLSAGGSANAPWGGYVETFGTPQALNELLSGGQNPAPQGQGAYGYGAGISYGIPGASATGQIQYYFKPYYLYKNPCPPRGPYRLEPRR